MHFLQFISRFISALLVCLHASNARCINIKSEVQGVVVAYTITVDQSGKGNFSKVQQAIDSISKNNKEWIRIHVKSGIYNEKVQIPRDKPFIVLEGESTRTTTVIQWGDAGSSFQSSTFTLLADNFVATRITFKNTYNQILSPVNGVKVSWAPAALIQADKVSFYQCGFVSLQDTLADIVGRHLFDQCYIEGAIDFIWGSGQSIYQQCSIKVMASVLQGNQAYITAQGRDSPTDNSGFVFKYCILSGTGPAYLGRAYRKYARVLFYRTEISNIIIPDGWSAWNFRGQEDTIVFAEVDCSGLGANKSKRVKWEKNLTVGYLRWLTSTDKYIDKEGWIEKQPQSQ